MRARLEIVPVGVIKLSRPKIRSNNALNTTALRPPAITSTRGAHLRRGLSSCTPSAPKERRSDQAPRAASCARARSGTSAAQQCCTMSRSAPE
jgi:hypothetical protein